MQIRRKVDMTQSALSAELKRYEPELIAIRHDIHRHPEVGFEETRTAKLVTDPGRPTTPGSLRLRSR